MGTSEKAPFRPPSAEAIEAARRLGAEALQNEPCARAIAYDRSTRRFQLALVNGTAIEFAADLVEELAGATDEQLAEACIVSPGGAVAWPSLDVHVSVEGLILDLFGGERWRRALQAELNRRLARSGSEARTRASRENGKKGGRPRKTKPA